jgi:hypothetical protein
MRLIELSRERDMNREWLDITPEQYHELDAFGSGAIRTYVVDGLAEFWAKCIKKIKQRAETNALRLGRAFHAAMEDPDSWRDMVIETPHAIDDDELAAQANTELIDGKSKKVPATVGARLNRQYPTHRRWVELWEERAQRDGLDILSADAIANLNLMIRSVYDNTECCEILEDKNHLNVEVACVCQHTSGVMLKALIDLMHGECVTDFKTTCEARPEGFIRFAWKHGYLWQAAHYCLVAGKERFRFISVRNEPPYESNVFEVPPQLLHPRIEQVDRQVTELAQVMTNSQMDSLDCQGMPLSYHNEGWGSVIPLDIDMFMQGRQA